MPWAQKWNRSTVCTLTAEHVLRKIHHCTFGRKISERPFFSHHLFFYDFLALRMWQTTPPFLLLNPKFSPHKFLHDLFLRILLKLHFFPRKFWWPFLVITTFYDFCPSVFSYFTNDESYSYFWHTIHPLYTHPHAV